MTQHTPGPWTVAKAGYGALWAGPAQIPHPGRDAIRLDEKLAQREADARLIAAAPDLLAALQDLLAQAQDCRDSTFRAFAAPAMADARAAIARATGA